MRPLEVLYNEGFMSSRRKVQWRAPIICEAVLKAIDAKMIIDVGCATGDLVTDYIRRGVSAWGLEGSSEALKYLMCPLDRFILHDLRMEWRGQYLYPTLFDLATCWEVLEHIEAEFADEAVRTLVSFAPIVLISAAKPNQEGLGHVNCQSQSYWEWKFRKHLYFRREDLEEKVKRGLDSVKDKKAIRAIYRNLMCFERL